MISACVIPAKAEIHWHQWTPAFAGVTCLFVYLHPHAVIPAKAGIHCHAVWQA